jgi:molybdopterin synthase sulfur carrier subunit
MYQATTSVPTVSLRVLLFASYADVLGMPELTLTLPAPAILADVVAHLRDLPGGDRLPARPLCARNLDHAIATTPVVDGDEIAVLPPLAGG